LFLSRLILGGVFLYASIDKIAFPDQFAEIIRNYHILPEALVGFSARTLPLLELLLGIFLVSGIFTRVSSISLSFLLLIFIIAVAVNSINGHFESCGCFSVSNQNTESSALIVIGRNLTLIFIGLTIVFTKGETSHEID